MFCLQLTDDELTIEDKAKKGRIALTKAKIFGGVDETAAQKADVTARWRAGRRRRRTSCSAAPTVIRSGVRQDTKHPGLPALVVPEGCACPRCNSKFIKAIAATIGIHHNKKTGNINWHVQIRCPKCGKCTVKKSLSLIFDGKLEKLHDFQENMEKRGKLEMAAYKKALPAE